MSQCDHTGVVLIHGFRVQSYGKRVSPGFKKALGRLAERGYDDPACVVVKTAGGRQSGITHAGGRYVPPDSGYRSEVMQEMRNLGMEPPPPPFLVAPGECVLYHEWGHHVDRTWSGDTQDVRFSFRWLSHFYQLCESPSRGSRIGLRQSAESIDLRPIASEWHAADAVILWWQASSELFADLFEDWMRGDKKVSWDECDPRNMSRSELGGNPFVQLDLLPGVPVEDVRAAAYKLFAGGLRSAPDPPPVRPGLLGPRTEEMIGQLCDAMNRERERQ